MISRYHGTSVRLLERHAQYVRIDGVPRRPHPCGRLLPNDLGLFDMLGNAREWCHEYYTGYGTDIIESTIGDVTDDNPHSRRVLRGGSFNHPPEMIRSPDRDTSVMSMLSGDIGFRPARTCDRTPAASERFPALQRG